MKVLNLSRADVSLASDVPGNILSRFLNGNSHLPTHLDRLKNWLNHLNSNNVMTEQESIEMAKVKKECSEILKNARDLLKENKLVCDDISVSFGILFYILSHTDLMFTIFVLVSS